MRAQALTAAAFAAGLAGLVGCHHEKHKLAPTTVEEYRLPPNEKRFNEPPTEEWKPPPPKAPDKSLSGSKMPMRGGPVGPGGF